MIMNMFMFKAAIVLMVIIILREVLRKKYGIDMDSIDVKQLKELKNSNWLKSLKSAAINKKINQAAIVRKSGTKTLILKDAGVNKATVMATLRQITGLDYQSAKNIIESAPSTIMMNVSDKEADLTKKALEFVGARIEIR